MFTIRRTRGEKLRTLEPRGIKRGVEVLIGDPLDPDKPKRKARVVNVYPPPSSWLIVQYEDDGSMEEVEETQVTTMYEFNREKYGWW